MKVAVFHDWFEKIGFEEQILKAILEQVDDVDLYTFNNQQAEFTRELNYANFYDLNLKINFGNAHKQIEKFTLELQKIINRNYDVVISNSVGPMRWVKEISFAQNRKLPIQIAYTHSPYLFLYDDLLDNHQLLFETNKAVQIDESALADLKRKDLSFARGIDFCITNSKMMQMKLKRHYTLDAKVIYPPVDKNVFYANGKRHKSHFFIETPLELNHSFETVLKSFNYVNDILVVAGSGDFFEEYEDVSRANIRYVGELEPLDKADLIKESHAVIVADTEHHQQSALEALHCHIPIIAHRQSCAQELISEGVNGVLYGEDSADGLLSALFNFKEIEFHRDKLAQQAKGFQYNFADTFKKFYQEAILESNLT